MKEKIERFNQDEQLRDMAYKRSLNRWANERDKQDMYEKGKEEGIEEGIKQGLEMGIEQGKYNLIKQLFNKYYPKEDDSILENLNNEQYDKIFEMILNNYSIEKSRILLINEFYVCIKHIFRVIVLGIKVATLKIETIIKS
ncbi:MAG: hypothetical protein ACLTAI_03175 [Thomasclavelia sp.]